MRLENSRLTPIMSSIRDPIVKIFDVAMHLFAKTIATCTVLLVSGFYPTCILVGVHESASEVVSLNRSRESWTFSPSSKPRRERFDLSVHESSIDEEESDDIERIFGLIAEHPQIGRQRPEVMPGLRSFAIAPWVIFYRIEDEAVGIVRIIHGARDLDEVDY